MLICLNAVAECGQSEREEMENCMMELSAGNTAAMEPLYRIANPSVYAFALSLLKSSHDAEEIAQECFVRAYLGAAGYRPQGKPMAWLITITRNLCMEKLRERGKRSGLAGGQAGFGAVPEGSGRQRTAGSDTPCRRRHEAQGNG